MRTPLCRKQNVRPTKSDEREQLRGQVQNCLAILIKLVVEKVFLCHPLFAIRNTRGSSSEN